ncbi:MAG: phosphoribosyltransferase family protein [Sulfuricurvum sp.]|uniref:phosphoribosyltransferase n=1 Tax=Sulfuricurvum sp. TaxID=2025608 RepID=UPI002621FE10|nr:phosphoribosyltransferase family protein [Sulfuricurvum sp.]MDD2369310.1 phosphoribosyltransferase family protein [Sulfuricurvum sp.]MDD2949575.1 phosphoribosyltransferase family protein [Sulfuricurvum sp.]MDD5117506.1 phosphoribosyltransferase family protein [Sulfuricurvum sp.]
MIYYDYKRFCTDVQHLSEQCKPFEADTILAVARGGMSLAHALSMALDVRNLHTIRVESYDGDSQRDKVSILSQCDLTGSRQVLVVDDIVDSGRTLFALLPILRLQNPTCEFKVATLFTKPTALMQPDFSLHEATDWIDFFWERDFLKKGSL